jgi:hypothetical protein
LTKGRNPARYRTDIHNSSGSALTHAGQYLLQASDRAADIHIHTIEVQLWWAFFRDRVASDAGVIYQNIHHVSVGENPLESGSD